MSKRIIEILALSAAFTILTACSGGQDVMTYIESNKQLSDFAESTKPVTDEITTTEESTESIIPVQPGEPAATQTESLPEEIAIIDVTSVQEVTESITEQVQTETTEQVVQTEPEVPQVNEGDPFGVVVSQYAADQAAIAEQKAAISAQKTLPVVYITSENRQEIVSKDFYVNSVVDVFNCDPSFQLCETAKVRVRGNSSALMPEKPYRIKFTSKQSMLGLNEGQKFKNWVLLKTEWHLTPDYLTFKLYEAMNGEKYYGSDSMFVNVYLNGVYRGMYLLCEQTQVAKGRIEVYEPEPGDTDVNIGYLLELDNYADGKDPYFVINYTGQPLTDILGQTRVPEHGNYTIKSDVTSDSQIQFISKYITNLYMIMYYAAVENTAYRFNDNYDIVPATDITPQQAVEQYVDLDSIADMLIIDELAHDYDVGEGSKYLAVDFTPGSKYPKVTMIAPWDYTWAYYYDDGQEGYFASTWQNIQSDGDDRSNIMYITLMRADWFRDIVSRRFRDYAERQVIETTANNVAAIVQGARGDLGDKGWEVDCAAKVSQFVINRVNWLKTVW